MSQGEKDEVHKKKKKEEQEHANSLLEEDTEEEMKKWRGMSQDEMDQCWRSLAGKNELKF